jgi:membrane protein DedA with SNARE-associated domain
MHHLLEIWFSWVLSGGYVGIIVLMAMGSTPLPVPAEVVLPPAAFLAAQGKLNIAGVILAGRSGRILAQHSCIGSRDGLAGRWYYGLAALFIYAEETRRSKHWLNRYEAGGVFCARIASRAPSDPFRRNAG